MAPPVKDRQQLPDIAKPTADLIERLGFKWELDYEYQLPELGQRIQIRDTKHYAPAAQVSNYAAAMRRGDKFPPIVVTKDGHLLDGNTRVTAATKNKRPDLPAFVLNVDYESATGSARNRLHLLGAGFNARNGKGIDRVEIANVVRAVVGAGDYDATRVAALLGVTDSTIQGIFAEQKARERAAKLGIELNGSVPASQVKTLGQRSPKLNDQPFAAITRLTLDAGLAQDELRELCNRVQAAGSDEEKLALVAEEQQAREEQIAEYKATGKKKPPVSGELRRKLGYIFAFESDPQSLVERNKDVADKHLEQLAKAIKILKVAETAQRDLLEAA